MLNRLNYYRGKPDEERSYGGVFFVCVVILFACIVWLFKDEFIDRRPWKGYQIEADKIEYKKLKDMFIKEEKKVIKEKKELLAKIEKAKDERTKSAEYKNTVDKLSKLNVVIDDLSQESKFAKGRLDEAYYWYKHALHEESDDVDEKKRILEEKQDEVDSYAPKLEKLNREKESLEKKIKEMSSKEKKFNSSLYKLTSSLDIIKGNMDAIKTNFLFIDFYRIPQIKQVVIRGLDTGNFKEPIMRVDRCETCHSKIDKDGFEEEDHPYRTHPDRKLYLGTHKKDKFGCTVCHMGQGPGISSVEKGHGEFHHINDITPGKYEPLYKGNFVYSSCRKCHESQFELKEASILMKGKRKFIKLGCHGCHFVKGYDNLRKVGPVLKRVGAKVDPGWLYRWVKRPKDYLPLTRMPFFNLSDEDAVAVTAYLINSSDKTYKPDRIYVKGSGVIEMGKKLFETIGCLGCHSINGKGNVFAPNLSNIANKVNADWLISWVKNPKQYNEKTIMPSLRLSDEEAEAITAYLMTLGKKEKVPGLDEKIRKKEVIERGRRVIRKRGCFACHEIRGMEKEQRIAPELTSFGNKRLVQLEFGDSKVPHNWEAWTRNKLKDPSTYRTERVLDKMPNFDLSADEIDELVVLLKSFRGVKVPEKFKRILSKEEEDIENGRKLVWEFNCYGCHKIEDKGGFIAKFYKTSSDAPPLLESGNFHEGERVQGSWLFAFLKKPEPIRPWLKVRMPTFYFTDSEVSGITRYFSALAKSDSIYDYFEQRDKKDEGLVAGELLMSRDYFDCFNCHVQGDKMPEGPPEGWAPDLSKARRRLRPDWIIKWLKNPQNLQPGTKMPTYFDDEDSGPDDILGGDEGKQIEAIMHYVMHLESLNRL